MKKWVCVLLILVSSGCASRLSKSTIVLEYSDFGPQAMAYRVIGRKSMPWAPDTPIAPGEDKINVVVYRGIAKSRVEGAFLPDRDDHIDYRYVSYSDALSYLDAQIAQNILRKVTVKLENTKNLIQQHLGERHD